MSSNVLAYHKDIIHRITVLCAQFMGDADIRKTILEEFGVEVKRGYAHAYLSQPGSSPNMKMRALREAYCKKVMDMPIAQKAVRLDRLEKIYQDNKDSKDKDNKTLAIRALSEARAEVEGSKTIQFLQFNKFEGKSDGELLALRNKLLGELRKFSRNGSPIIDTETVGVDRSGDDGAAADDEAALLRSSSDPILLPHLHETH